MSLAKIIARYLDDQGLAVWAENVFTNNRPARPIKCLSIYNSGGLPNTGDDTETQLVQIVARAESYDEAYNLLEPIHEIFKEKYTFWLGDSQIWVLKSEAQSQIGQVGKEGEGEQDYLVACNYSFWLKDFSK